jgi:multidrug efflux system outer membrane protein
VRGDPGIEPITLRTLVLLIISALMARCASAPPVRQPPVGIAIPTARSAAADNARTAGVWWRQFGDPALETVIAEALASNRDLRATAARVERAAALARATAADAWPTVGAGLNVTGRKQNFIGLPIPGAEGQVLSTQVATYGVSIDTSWEADLWGRIRSTSAASYADAEAAALDAAGATLSLTGLTAKTWFVLIEARQQVRLADASTESSRLTADQVRERYERGLRPPGDLRLALSNLHAAEASLAQRREQYERALRQFEVLLGRYPAGAAQPPDSLPAMPNDVPAGLPSDLLARRPDIRAAERRVAAADARLISSRKALYPSFALTGSGGVITNALRRLLDGDFSVWSLAGALVQPIFQGGRLRARIDAADADTREALELYASRALTAFGEVEAALAAHEQLAARAARLADAAVHATAARTLAEQRYASGLEPILTVLESQRRQFDAEGQLLLVRRLQLDARVDLHLALGGDTEDAKVKP